VGHLQNKATLSQPFSLLISIIILQEHRLEWSKMWFISFSSRTFKCTSSRVCRVGCSLCKVCLRHFICNAM